MAELFIDLDERFVDETEFDFDKLTDDPHGFINLLCEIKDEWLVYNDQKLLSMDEIKTYGKTERANYFALYIRRSKTGIDHFEISEDDVPIYDRTQPIIINDVELTDGWFCVSLISP